ncbi:hypothetical protein BEI59_23765 [Eisenbergiella tayi]|uniref:Uncharacterized protein n=1 Tax=Eisenbergiella tayi TaxID=1432052 RepID=A0A1E3UCG5_9FIRM|nr:hypothetical protein BEI59_23765 [Eisenbergiella tayi]ODR49808.1 hypothetical protein BEI63_22030 [Eisenbergiella tayi]ODR51211.1 hypothetical protein BEI64_27690 [Eisenbergiella tayi]
MNFQFVLINIFCSCSITILSCFPSEHPETKETDIPFPAANPFLICSSERGYAPSPEAFNVTAAAG